MAIVGFSCIRGTVIRVFTQALCPAAGDEVSRTEVQSRPCLLPPKPGWSAPTAYITCAVLMGLIVSCFASAGSRVSLTGGLYAYVGVAFGPFIGFLAG